METGEFRAPVAVRQGNEKLPSAREVSNAIHTSSEADTKQGPDSIRTNF